MLTSMTKEEYIKNIELLNYYTKKYDEGNPEISDEAWDVLYFECCRYEEETGYVSEKSPSSKIIFDVKSSLRKVTHNHSMLSLAKINNDPVALRKWLKELSIVMYKMDGLTCSLCYEDGKLISAETRGNGQIGEDILHNAKVIPSIPKTIPTKERTIVDGEVICTYKYFADFEDMYENPRNFASGSIRLDNAKECSTRNLTFVAWDLITGTQNLSTKLSLLKDYGFVVTRFEVVDLDNLEEQIERLRQAASDDSYPIDGLVYKIDDYNSYMAKGYNEHDFAGGIAFKFYDPEFETQLLDIEWSVGKTGAITPVAIFAPVRIDGATIRRASMHNVTIMRNLLGDNPREGQKIWVKRANMVIPQITRSEK